MSQLVSKEPKKYLNKMQQGGTVLEKLLQSYNTNSTSKQDNTKAAPVPKLQKKIADKDSFGRTLPQARDQGKIDVPYQRSLRENIIQGLNKLDRDGDNMVAGIVTEPVKAGMRLLRPDKYFENVHGDSDIVPALGGLALDAATVAPIVNEGRVTLKALRPSNLKIAANTNPSLFNNVFGSKYTPATAEGEAELQKARTWMQDWSNHPEIRKRISANNFQLGTGEEVTQTFKPDLNFASKDQAKFLDQHNGSNSTYGEYVHNTSNPNIRPDLPGKAFVRTNTPVDQMKSTGVHELTHQLTDGNTKLSNHNKMFLRSIFGGTETKMRMLAQNPEHEATLKYLMEPTEVHARVNELRNHFNMTPDMQIGSYEATTLRDFIRAGRTPVDRNFGLMINDVGALREVFNKMFTPAAIAGTAVYGTKK